MGQKMTWDEMRREFPDEWLLVVDFTVDQFGEIATGSIVKHTKDMDDIATWPPLNQPTAFRFTGESTFAGLRSHAANHHTI